jgi:hypothetical protein
MLGLVELSIGVGVLVKNQLSRATAVVVLGLHSVAQLLMVRVDPLFSAATLTLDLTALYALTRYGGKAAQTEMAIPLRQSLAQGNAFSRAVTRKLFPPSISGPSEPNGNRGQERPSHQLMAWRRSADGVVRAWNEWLAADGRDGSAHYRRYVSCLAEEARAAGEFERALSRGGLAPENGCS